MPRFVTLLLLGMGLLFVAVAVFVGLVGVPYARGEAARLEQLRPLSAAALEDLPAGAEVLVEGAVSPRNRPVFRDFVAYEREELDVSTDSDGDRKQTWRSAGGEWPPLILEAGGAVTVAGGGYNIARGHATWYDEATLGFGGQERDGSVRYHGLVAGGALTAVGTVVAGREGNELAATTVFGGTRDEFLASQRGSVTFLMVFAAIFGAVGLILDTVGVVLLVRYPPGPARRGRRSASS